MKAGNRPGWRMGKCRDCDNKYQRERNQGIYHDRHRQICKNYKDRIRAELHKEYGGECVCCGEKTSEFLELDHINGGGRNHRKTFKKDLYKVIKDEGYPKDKYRLLCSNCNHSLGVRGYCPHQKNANKF